MAAKTADEAEERAFGYRLIRILQPTPSMAWYALIGAIVTMVASGLRPGVSSLGSLLLAT